MLKNYKKAKDIKQIRNCFPSLAYSDLTYLDNAASSQTVDSSIKAVSDYHYNYRANVHRGDFKTSTIASEKYDEARVEVAKLINAEPHEIVFTNGTTASLNIIADWTPLEPTIIMTEVEHHSNILPWMQQGRTRANGQLVIVPSNDEGNVDVNAWYEAVKDNPGSTCSFLTQSNFTGQELPWQQMIMIAKEHDCEVVIDACQSIGHKPIDVKKNDIDWMAFSGHKMYASTGTGVLYHKGGFDDVQTWLGGGTITQCDFDTFTLKRGPERMEAGTPNVAGVHSLGAAAKWIQDITYNEIHECEKEFFNMLKDKGLFEIEQMELIGPIKPNSVYSFKVKGTSPSDIAGFLDMQNVCVRTGHMCAYPASMKYTNNEGILRISSAPYNDEHDCVKLVEGLWQAIEKMKL